MAELPQPKKSELFLEHTLAIWQPRSKRVLSRTDAHQIANNVASFFSILHEWKNASAGPLKVNEESKP